MPAGPVAFASSLVLAKHHLNINYLQQR